MDDTTVYSFVFFASGFMIFLVGLFTKSSIYIINVLTHISIFIGLAFLLNYIGNLPKQSGDYVTTTSGAVVQTIGKNEFYYTISDLLVVFFIRILVDWYYRKTLVKGNLDYVYYLLNDLFMLFTFIQIVLILKTGYKYKWRPLSLQNSFIILLSFLNKIIVFLSAIILYFYTADG